MSGEKTGARSDSLVDELIDGYVSSLAERRYSPRSIEIRERTLRDFAGYLAEQGIKDIVSVTPEKIEDYRRHLFERGFKRSSVDIYLRSAGQLFRFLTDRKLIFDNPMEAVEPVRDIRSLIPVPNEEHIRTLLGLPDVSRPIAIRDRAVLETMYSTGMRLDETHRLRVRDVDLENGTVLIQGKGDRERVAPLGQTAREWIRRYLTEVRKSWVKEVGVEALWVASTGMPVGRQGLYVMIKSYARCTGIEPLVTPHGIRRACATHMLQRGASPLQIQLLLGHSSLRHLSQYLRLSITDIRAMHAESPLGQ